MKIAKIIDVYRLREDSYYGDMLTKLAYNPEDEIIIIVVTGGPCGGKTSLISLLKRRFLISKDSEAFFAQEAATCLKNDHITYFSAGEGLNFQTMILKHQLTAEASAIFAAICYKTMHSDKKVYCVFDRSIMDGQAYFKEKEDFDRVLKYSDLTTESVYERYDKVIHLVSAAVDAVFAYTTSDGTPRDEKPEDAKKLDFKVRDAWSGHPSFEIVTNTFKFDQKLSKAMSIIFSLTGTKIPVGTCKRFIIPIPSIYELQSRAMHLQIFMDKTLFLLPKITSPNTLRSIRIRKSGESVSYHLNEQLWDYVPNPDSNSPSEEAVYDVTSDLTKDDAINSILEIDCHLHPLERVVYTFYLTDTIFCELSTFQCNGQYAYLKVTFEGTKEQFVEDYKILRRFFADSREVTFERRFSEYYIAETNGKCLNPPT